MTQHVNTRQARLGRTESCCAVSDWFTEEEKGRVEMRSISFRDVVTYRRSTEEMCVASAAASVAFIADDRV